MIKMSRRSILKTSSVAIAAASMPKFSRAQAAAYGPDDLKSTLTPFGALRAGNADGSIPAWTGGYSTVPAGYKQGDPREIPFADEKPVVVITAANASQYKDKLSPGVLTIFQKYPDYVVNVYPTHRTAIAPQWVYDNIYKNASRTQISADGNTVTGAYGGIPFPIPKDGHEAMWNHLLAWCGTTIHSVTEAHTITAAGAVIFEARAVNWIQFPYYKENGESGWDGFYHDSLILPVAPPYEAGGNILVHQSANPQVLPDEGWLYLTGQRRVRRAPELEYDTPDSLSGGTVNWDEENVFYGDLQEYDIKLIGTKELYIPYNTNKAVNATAAEQFLPHFVNPDLTRWELHRVRVVEMTVKAGSRNVDARRTIYLDEDTGSAVLNEIYAADGSLWKVCHVMPMILPDVPCVLCDQFYISYNLQAGDYSASNCPNATTQPQWAVVAELPASFFTPGQLAATAQGF